MKITVLGSGSCYGVPTIGNDWGDCNPDNPKNRRTVASLMIETAQTKILIDMSPDFREQSIRHDVTNLDAVLFTHGHADHILGNFYLPRLLQYYKGKALPLYADKETQHQIEKAFWFQMKENGNVVFSYGGQTHWETLVPFQDFTIGDLNITPLLQDHGDITSLAFRSGNFAYSTDFNNLSAETLAQLHGLDCWIVECNRRYTSDNKSMHLYLDRVLELIAELKPKKAYLTHMGVSMDYDSVSAELPDNVYLAYDGLELTV
jgi:phosphoribosyl 1,2-cyclic phosphate phosphodiesterase